MFDIGQNDLAGAFYSKTLDQVFASIPTILSEFETGIKVGIVVSNIQLMHFQFTLSDSLYLFIFIFLISSIPESMLQFTEFSIKLTSRSSFFWVLETV